MNEDTRKEVGKCPECDSIDKGTRYSIAPQRFCKNAWHDVPPEVQQDEFTALEFEVIFGMCWSGMRWRLSNKEIAEQCGIAEDVVQRTATSAFDKIGASGRMNLFEFVRDALNRELRRRRAPSPEGR